jgi:hypothetical protein
MEPRSPEEPLESRDEDQSSSSRPPERQRRFRIVKLEERIAPGAVGFAANTDHFDKCSGPTHGVGCTKKTY